jgi:hypothetical protein
VSNWHLSTYSISIASSVPQRGAWEQRSASILARWSSAYNAYLDIRDDYITDLKRQGTAAFSILKELGFSANTLTRMKVDNETNWDVFIGFFSKVVALVDDIVELDLKAEARRPAFCMNMAVIRLLFQVSLIVHSVQILHAQNRKHKNTIYH